jgi:hypothetical protein
MPKAVFAAALAVGLVIAPIPQLISSAAAQQKATASDKNAKTKKDPSAGQLEMCRRVEGSESRQQGLERSDLAKILERLQQASQVRFQIAAAKF